MKRRRRRYLKEAAIKFVFFLCAVVSIVTTIGIVAVLAEETISFFREVSFVEFYTSTRWAPQFKPPGFGIAPLVCGTILVAAGAALIAIPVGLASALFLSDYASPRLRGVLKPTLEVLAGIPTVVYGYFALTSVTPMLRAVLPDVDVFNAASASIVVGIMILPMVASLSDDALRAVPQHLRQAGYALGANKFEVTTRVVLPAALSGVLASFLLAISRAIGETMAVTLAAGGKPTLTLDPRESIQTMTAFMVQVSLGDTPVGSLAYRTLFAVGMQLFLITLVMNLLANRVLKRFREVYE